MNNKQQEQPVQYTADMYPTYPSNPVYYSQPPARETTIPVLPTSSAAPIVSAIPVKVISQGTSQVVYLTPAMPGMVYDPLMLAHLPTLQFTSEAPIVTATSTSSSTSVPVTISQDVNVASASDSERLVNNSQGSSAPVALPADDLLPKKFTYFIVLGLISLAVAAFFLIHTPVLAGSDRMMTSYCYGGYGSKQSCYTYPKYWILNTLNGFGYTAAAVSILVAAFSIFQGLTKKKSHFTVASFVSMLFEALVSVFFLAGVIVFAVDNYNLGIDSMMGYIVAFFIHLAIFAANVYTFKKQGLVLNFTSTTSTTISSKTAVTGLGLSGFNVLLSITGIILTCVFHAWVYTAAPALAYLIGSTTALVANVMLISQRKNMKVVTTLLKIAAPASWMIVGLAIFASVVGIYIPFVFGITIPLAIFAGANAVHASVTLQAILASPSTH